MLVLHKTKPVTKDQLIIPEIVSYFQLDFDAANYYLVDPYLMKKLIFINIIGKHYNYWILSHWNDTWKIGMIERTHADKDIQYYQTVDMNFRYNIKNRTWEFKHNRGHIGMLIDKLCDYRTCIIAIDLIYYFTILNTLLLDYDVLSYIKSILFLDIPIRKSIKFI